MCIYGINEIPKMTQITPAEMAKQVCQTAAADGWDTGLITMVLAAGMVIGVSWRRASKKR